MNSINQIITCLSIFILLNLCFMPAITSSNLSSPAFQINQRNNILNHYNSNHTHEDHTTTYYAVIAACSQYKNPKNNIPKRPFRPIPEEKLQFFYNSMISHDNWKEDNIILLLNEEATYENITKALQHISEIIQPHDVFLFSWQGHGSAVADDNNDEPDSTDEIICTYDINKNETLLTDDHLNNLFSNITCKSQVLIFENCLSGSFTDGTDDVDRKNTIVITSSFPQSLSRATFLFGFPLHTALAVSINTTYNLTAQDKNNDGGLSIQEIFNHAKFIYAAENSVYWCGFWLYLFASLKKFRSANNAIMLIYLYLQFIAIIFTRHPLINYAKMTDKYYDELIFITNP